MKKRHVCQISPYLYPFPGGQELHAYMLSKHLAKLGWKVSIVTTNFPKGLTYEEHDGMEIYRTLRVVNPMYNPFTPSMIPIFLDLDVDIFHAHGYWNFSTNFSAFASKLKKVPIVITSHGYQPLKSFLGKFVRTFYLKTLGKFTLDNVSYMILNHQHDVPILKSLGVSEDRIEIIASAIDMKEFDPSINASDLIGKYKFEKTKQILFVGRLIKRKGCEFIVQALPQILKEVPNAKLLIVGEGPEEVRLRKTVKELNIEDSVVFFGYIRPLGTLLKKIYKSSHLLVLPSLDECMSRTILEAMSMKLPIVTTDNWYSKWLVQPEKEAALLVNPKNKSMLANAVIRILKEEELSQKLLKNGRHLIETSYNWKIITKRVIDLYEKCIKHAKWKR